MTYALNDRLRELDSTFLYVVRFLESATVLQFARLDQDITIAASSNPLPSFWNSGIFPASTASHSGLKLSSEPKSSGVNFTIVATHPAFQRYYAAPVTTRVSLDIYRLNNLDEPTIDDVEHLFYGELQGYGFQDFAFTAVFAPTSNCFDRSVPNSYYQRDCNNDFCGPGCNLNINDYRSTATITGFDRFARRVDCSIAGDKSALLFQQGFLFEATSSSNISIVTGQNGDGSARSIFVQVWIPEFEIIGATLAIFQGCMKTTAACKGYSNLPNFRGFPTIPTQNPTIGGVT